jgi:regulator of sigma E protease
VPEGFVAKMVQSRSPGFISVRVPYVIGKFAKDAAAEKAGLQVGDKLIALNGEPMQYFDQYLEAVPKHKNETIQLTAVRDGDTLTFNVKIPPEGKIGVYASNPSQFFDFSRKKYSVIEAIPAGAQKAYGTMGNYLKQLKLIFSPDVQAYKSVGGFITIGSIFPTSWDWQAFWNLTAFLSIMLAILNVLPIPALDGGHVMFLLYEIISGRKPGDKFMEYAQLAGMLILFAILILANGNDILRLFNG